MPVKHALQGHPESGVLWADLINRHLLMEMGFVNTKHEPCIYRGTLEGQEVLTCRQVDDFAFSSKEKMTLQQVLKELARCIDFFPEEEMLKRYNGVDVEQTRHYIKLSSRTYIYKIMDNHQWSKASRTERTMREPLSPSVIEKINTKFMKAKKKYFQNYIKISNCRIAQKFHKNFTTNFLYCDNDIKELKKKKKEKKKTEMSLFLKKYDYTNNSCFFVVKSMQNSLGTIKYLNQNVKKITGYTSDYLKNLSVSILLPHSISVSHDLFLKSFLKTGIRQLSLTERTVYLMTKNNFLIMPKLVIKNFFDFHSNEALFFALFKKKKNEKKFILCFQNGKIEGISDNLYKNLKWKNYDIKKDIYIQNLIPDFIKLFFKLCTIKHKDKTEEDIIDLIDFFFKDNKIQSNFRSKIYLDSINKEQGILNLKLENLLKKLKSKKSSLEIKNFKIFLKENLKYSTKKYNFTFKINVFKTKIGFFFTIIFLNISPITITKKALNSPITRSIYSLVIMKRFFRKKNRQEEEKKSTFLIKNKEIEKKRENTLKKNTPDYEIKKELNLNDRSNNLNHSSFVMNLLEKNFKPTIFKIFKFLTYFTILFFALSLIISQVFWTKTLKKLEKLNKFNFYETLIINDLFRLISFQYQYNKSVHFENINKNKYYNNTKINFYNHLNDLKDLVNEKSVFIIDDKYQEQIKIDLLISEFNENSHTNIFDGFFILFTEVTKDENLNNVSDVTIHNLISYSKHFEFFLNRDLIKKFISKDSENGEILILVLLGFVLIMIFVIIFLNWKLNNYLNETYELCRLIQKPKNLYFTISNFLSDYKLNNYFSLEKKESEDDKENIIQTRKKFKKISVNIFLIFVKYSILIFIFILILIFIFILIQVNMKDLQIFSMIKGDIIKNNFIILTTFSQLMNKKIEIKSNFDFFQDTLDEIVKELYVQKLEKYLYLYDPKICKMNYISYEDCISIYNGISKKGMLKTISLLKNNLYEMSQNLKIKNTFSEKKLIDTFKLFIIIEIYQEIFLEEELKFFQKSFKSFNNLLSFITFTVIIFSFFWFILEKFIFVNYMEKRIKKPVYLLKFIESKKFYSDSKLKTFINKINLS